MNVNFKKDWKHLLSLPFRRAEQLGALFKMLFSLLTRKKLKHGTDRWRLYIIKEWLLVPLSLWVVDIAGIGKHVARRVKEGRQLDDRMNFILDCLEKCPPPSAQKTVAELERLAEVGDYSNFLGNPEKFDVAQQNLYNNMDLQRRWRRIKELWDVDEFRDSTGLIHRTMWIERNEHTPDWNFNGDDERSLFQTAFDLMCCEFDLYGYLADRPLLLKPTVTVMPYGTVIVIPKYMSYDQRRDFVTKEVRRAHDVHHHLRQGPKWSRSRQEINMRAARTYIFNERALRQGLEGEERRKYVVENAKLNPNTDLRTIRRLANIGEKLFRVK